MTALDLMAMLFETEERVAHCAIQFPDGRRVTGRFHVECWYDAVNQGIIPSPPEMDGGLDTLGLLFQYGAEEGYETNQGRFLTREEAYELANKAHQIKPGTSADERKWLDSEDVIEP